MPKLNDKQNFRLVKDKKNSDEYIGIMSVWQALEETVNNIRLDIAKSANGNVEASRRARKGLRNIRTATTILIRESLKRMHVVQMKRKKEKRRSK